MNYFRHIGLIVVMVVGVLGVFYRTSEAKLKVDSLRQLVRSPTQDTYRVKALYKLGWQFRHNKLDSTRILSQEALQLAQQIDFKKGIGNALHNLANYHWRKGNLAQALKFYNKADQVWEKIGDKNNRASTMGNIGVIYADQGNYPKALDAYFKALKLSRQLKNTEDIGTWLYNIGNVYFEQNNYSKARSFYKKALQQFRKIDNKRGIAGNFGSIGIIYSKQKKYAKALDYFRKALRISKKIGNKRLVASWYSNLGTMYLDIYEADTMVHERKGPTEQYTALTRHTLLDSAIACQERAYTIRKAMGAKESLTLSLVNIGDILGHQQHYTKALQRYRLGYKLADSIGSLPSQKKLAKRLYRTHKEMGANNKALRWHERYARHKDSLFNKEKQKKIGRLESRHKWQKKQLQDSIRHAKELHQQQLRHQQKVQRQQYLLYSVGGGLLLVLVFSSILYNRFRVTRKQRDIIQQQKHIVDQKNKRITDSINYAKHIQDALLKEEEHVTPDLPEHFILHKPQATVSGDFYWSVLKNNIWYTAVADCTGHGVPGGFLTMLGTAFLNELTSETNQIRPAEILNHLRERFIRALGEEESPDDEDFRIRDGMDISLLRIDLQSRKGQWAGANNPLYIIRKGTANIAKPSSPAIRQGPHHDGSQLWEYRPDKQPISYTSDPQPFTNHELQLQKNDRLYLFSDGYPDQFGGPKGKKFMYKRFKRVLTEITNLSMQQQKNELDTTIEDWMSQNNEEQIDDICIQGIKIT